MSTLVASLLSLPVLTSAMLFGGTMLFTVLLRASRLPRAPWYADKALVELVLCPALVGMFCGGLVLAVKLGWRLHAGPLPTVSETLLAVGAGVVLIVITAVAARAMPPERPACPVVPLPGRGPAGAGPEGTPRLPRAA